MVTKTLNTYVHLWITFRPFIFYPKKYTSLESSWAGLHCNVPKYTGILGIFTPTLVGNGACAWCRPSRGYTLFPDFGIDPWQWMWSEKFFKSQIPMVIFVLRENEKPRESRHFSQGSTQEFTVRVIISRENRTIDTVRPSTTVYSLWLIHARPRQNV